ncbi:hypothetical protein Dda_3727 [Drechslerella dactyloides]|uniref:Tr-type G domain-containing protein n=1 Tax=Drechslerella dactyloides TaxID=74499 RepID=A0AAD6IZA8_DREDA|nr:hypothetical protein Dda_3727 [Drechslerella dactyloides]
MSSLFTFNHSPSPPSSPWNSALSTPIPAANSDGSGNARAATPTLVLSGPNKTKANGIQSLASEPQEGSTEYKLSLLHPNPLRLQHLTTQLLWRLQQSCPSHNTAGLVPPPVSIFENEEGDEQISSRAVDKAYYATLLQDSQGCFYEIGVADDGKLLGLAEEDLETSLNTLRTMADALGCMVEVVRRVNVANTTTEDGNTVPLWAAEALVRPCQITAAQATGKDTLPDATKSIPQVRITLTGPTNAGKSSLLGTLTSSTLDNGRGKSRLSLLKHRHEVATGVTSSIASELLGFTATGEMINYHSGNVGSWMDIHAIVGSSAADLKDGQDNLARTVFLLDSAGLFKYRRTAIRGLMGWAPHYTAIVMASDIELPDTAIGPAFEYLMLCLKLKLRFFLLITKLDLASNAGLRKLCRLAFEVIREAGKEPKVVQGGADEMTKFLTSNHDAVLDGSVVPVLLVSSVTGKGIDTFQTLIGRLPIPPPEKPPIATDEEDSSETSANLKPLFHIEDVFETNSTLVETVLGGHVKYGQINMGDKLFLGPFPSLSNSRPTTPASSFAEHSGKYLSRSPNMSPGRAAINNPTPEETGEWKAVKVVSIRKSRLPVGSLMAGEVGTIGLCQWSEVPAPEVPMTGPSSGPSHSAITRLLSSERLSPPPPTVHAPQPTAPHRGSLQKSVSFANTLDVPHSTHVGLSGDRRLRKGMVLLPCSGSVTAQPRISTGFSAEFDVTEERGGIPLSIGAHAIVYFGSVRTSVRVLDRVLVSSGDTEDTEDRSAEDGGGLFGFDEEDDEVADGGQQKVGAGTVRYSFGFTATVEWIEEGTTVLVTDSGRQGGAVGVGDVGLGLDAAMCGRISLFPSIDAAILAPQKRPIPALERPAATGPSAEVSTGWNRSSTGVDASDPVKNPANLLGPIRNIHNKRHNFPLAHSEILVGPTFPASYAQKLWKFYGDDAVDAPNLVYGYVTTNSSSCRPFYYSCDRATYLEFCNFSGKKYNLERRKVWEWTNVMLGSRMASITENGATFLDPSIQFDTPDLKSHPVTLVPQLSLYDRNLVAYTFKSDSPEVGIALYYNSPLATDQAWLDHFKLRCEDPPLDDEKWIDEP